MTDPTSNIPAKGTWVIDPVHSSLEFVARHMMVSKVKGRFTDVNGTIEVGGDGSEHSVRVSVEAASIDTRDEKRDEHLRSPEFLDVENHKQLTFVSTAVRQEGDGWVLDGDLTIRGTTRPVSIAFTFNGSGTNPWGAEVAGFEGHTSINRKDFGLEWNVALETGGVLVGDKVDINLDIEATKQG